VYAATRQKALAAARSAVESKAPPVCSDGVASFPASGMSAHGCCASLNEQARPSEVSLSAYISADPGLSAQTLSEHCGSESCATQITHGITQLQRWMLP